jgi:GTP cyclohydrolase I
VTVDLKRIEAAVVEILAAVGEEPDRDGLRATPARVARMYAEIFSGLNKDPGEYLRATFEADHDELVLVRDIALYSVCEHHLLPWFGTAGSRGCQKSSASWTVSPSGPRCRRG